MKTVTIMQITSDELLDLFQETYNKLNKTNHQFEIKTPIPKELQFQLTAWDKDEDSH